MQIRRDPTLTGATAHQMIQKQIEMSRYCAHRKGRADQIVPLRAEQFACGQVQIVNPPGAIKSDVGYRRKLVEIGITLDREIQFAVSALKFVRGDRALAI